MEDNNDLLDRDQFFELMYKICPQYSDEDIENVFLQCDAQALGMVSMESVKEYMETLARQEEEYQLLWSHQQQLYKKELDLAAEENESLKLRLETEIPNLEAEKNEAEKKISQLKLRVDMLEEDNRKLTSDVAVLRKREEEFRQNQRRIEDVASDLSKAEADVSRYRNMWETDRESLQKLRGENSSLLRSVSELKRSKDEAELENKKMRMELENVESMKTHLQSQLDTLIENQTSDKSSQDDEYLEREKTLRRQMSELSKELMDVKLANRLNSNNLSRSASDTSLLSEATQFLSAEGAQSLAGQLGELEGQKGSSEILELKAFIAQLQVENRELQGNNARLKEQNTKYSKLVKEYQSREAESEDIGLQHSTTVDKLIKRHQLTVEKLISEKEELHSNLTSEMDAHHETKRKLCKLETDSRRADVTPLPSLHEVEGQLHDQISTLRRKHTLEKESWETEKLNLQKQLSTSLTSTPGETPQLPADAGEGEELSELREKLGDGKMSDVYHCLEAGMRCDQIKQLIQLDCDLFLSAKYTDLGFHFNEVKVLATAAHPPRPAAGATYELKQLDMLVRDIRTLIDLRANLKHVIKCKKVGMFFAEIEDLLRINVENLDHASQCRQAGLSLAQMKEIYELRRDTYLPLFAVARCIKTGISFSQIKELTSLDIYLFNAAKLKEEGFSFTQIRDLGRLDRSLTMASELRLKKKLCFDDVREMVTRTCEVKI